MNNGSLSSPEGISLKEYVNDKFDNLEKSIETQIASVTSATNAAIASADKAVAKAEQASEKRFEGINEFRAALQDSTSKNVARTEFDLVVSRLEKDIKNLQLARAELIPRTEALGLFKSMDEKFKEVSNELAKLREYRSESSGRGKGIDDGWKYLIGIVTLLGGLVGLFAFFR